MTDPSARSMRRAFLEALSSLLLAIPVLGPALLSLWVVVRPRGRRPKITVAALKAFEIPEDVPKPHRLRYRRQHGAYIEDAERVVYLRRNGDEVIALSAECTHLGCNVHYDAAEKRFLCPCHKGNFDLDGNVLAGPPPRPLTRLRVIVPNDAKQPIQIEV